MTEQQFSDGLLWAFGVIGGLMALLFIVLGAAVMALFIRETARRIRQQGHAQHRDRAKSMGGAQ